ncbi:c-type cytochrome [uncultured Nitrospira sp.]|uniref:c-type cytochrome n=1 Tax=uncultured Nitrospira sp. TaxID=157176 RepID=UPI0031405F6D
MGVSVFGIDCRTTSGFINGAVLLVWILVGFLVPARAADLTNEGEGIVQSTCVGCHRIHGSPMPRSTKQAPDLIWAGNKYQRDWLVVWLQNPKEKLYPVGYDFKFKRKGRHLALLPGEAEKVADFLSTLKDVRITEGLMKPGTSAELARGEQLYREHVCQNCHWTPADNPRGYTGGTSSTSFVNMGNRLQADWVYRFNLNPDDFVPGSGAYIPNPSLPEKDIYAITTYMMTFK